MAVSILLFTLSGVRLLFLVRNARDQLTIIVSLIRILKLLLLGCGILGFTSCVPPVTPVLQGLKQINPLFGRDSVVVIAKLLLELFLYHLVKYFLDCLGGNILLVVHVSGFPDGVIVLLIIPYRSRG